MSTQDKVAIAISIAAMLLSVVALWLSLKTPQ